MFKKEIALGICIAGALLCGYFAYMSRVPMVEYDQFKTVNILSTEQVSVNATKTVYSVVTVHVIVYMFGPGWTFIFILLTATLSCLIALYAKLILNEVPPEPWLGETL